MAPIDPANNAADISNANKGTSGTNARYAKNQGNRGKQLNPNRNLVTFQVERGLLTREDCESLGLELLTASQVQRLLRECPQTDEKHLWQIDAYDFFRFIRPIKGGNRNISGALQRIRGVMSGKLQNKQSSRFWINSTLHTDRKHPDEQELPDYCPAIDGYW